MHITVVGVYLLSRVLATNVGSIQVLDPLVYGTVAGVLALAALLAAWLPALRATQVDPAVALRAE